MESVHTPIESNFNNVSEFEEYYWFSEDVIYDDYLPVDEQHVSYFDGINSEDSDTDENKVSSRAKNGKIGKISKHHNIYIEKNNVRPMNLRKSTGKLKDEYSPANPRSVLKGKMYGSSSIKSVAKGKSGIESIQSRRIESRNKSDRLTADIYDDNEDHDEDDEDFSVQPTDNSIISDNDYSEESNNKNKRRSPRINKLKSRNNTKVSYDNNPNARPRRSLNSRKRTSYADYVSDFDSDISFIEDKLKKNSIKSDKSRKTKKQVINSDSEKSLVSMTESDDDDNNNNNIDSIELPKLIKEQIKELPVHNLLLGLVSNNSQLVGK